MRVHFEAVHNGYGTQNVAIFALRYLRAHHEGYVCYDLLELQALRICSWMNFCSERIVWTYSKQAKKEFFAVTGETHTCSTRKQIGSHVHFTQRIRFFFCLHKHNGLRESKFSCFITVKQRHVHVVFNVHEIWISDLQGKQRWQHGPFFKFRDVDCGKVSLHANTFQQSLFSRHVDSACQTRKVASKTRTHTQTYAKWCMSRLHITTSPADTRSMPN